MADDLDVMRYLKTHSNWGRWGADDQAGAINLITPEKRQQAASLVRRGESMSLSRPYPKVPGPGNPHPALHYVQYTSQSFGGSAVDFYGTAYHGVASTHIDALCHMWGSDGLYNARDPADVISSSGATFGHIDNWRDGIITRGVLLDVPRFRGTPFVTQEEPVTAAELRAICQADGIEVTAGDALVVHSGREAWDSAHGRPWGSKAPDAVPNGVHPDRPGLDASCLEFVRETDCSVLVWDMMDMFPSGLPVPWSVHMALFAFGVALLDNALLSPLAARCAEDARHEFMLMVAPLRVEGGTGSPVNPLAVL